MPAATHPRASAAWESRERRRFRTSFAPPPRLTIDAWADKYRKLSSVNSAEAGDWSTDRVPWIRGILDAIADPEYHMVVFQKPAQVAYTEGIMGNTLGYHIHQRPCSILVVQPSKEDAEDWSKDKLFNLIEATPVLRDLVADTTTKGAGSTLLTKKYPGGMLKIVGGTSPKGLARTSAPLVIIDEADRMPRSAGKEGRPIDIVLKRLTTFWNGKAIIGSTPTNDGESAIAELLADSDHRQYRVPCPHCGHLQMLQWGGPDKSFGLKWETREVGRKRLVVPDSVFYLCEHCASSIEEVQKYSMTREGVWHATNTDGATPGVAGFHMNALVSPFDRVRWPLLVQEFLDAGRDHDRLKVFVNTRLGEVWVIPGGRVDPHQLEALAETWESANGERVEVPVGVGLLTAAVDVQDDRLEVLVLGWGEHEESWMIAHHRLPGDPALPQVWQLLEGVRTRTYRHASGAGLRIQAMAVDSGFRKNEVYAYVAPRQGENVIAVKGIGPEQAEPIKRSRSKNAAGVKLVTIGTVPMKDTLFSRLRKRIPEGGRPPEGYVHLRARDLDWHNGADSEFFAQFGRERVEYRNRIRTYVKTGPNEAVDLYVYNLAALHHLGPIERARLGERAREIAAAGGKHVEGAGVRRPKRRLRSRGIR